MSESEKAAADLAKSVNKPIDPTGDETANANTDVPMEEDPDSVDESETFGGDAGEPDHLPMGPPRHKPSGTKAAQSTAPSAKKKSEPPPADEPPLRVGHTTAGHRHLSWVKCCAPEWMRAYLTGEMIADAANLAILDLIDPQRPGGRVENIEEKIAAGDLKRKGGPWWIAFTWNGAALAFVGGTEATLYIDMPGGETGEVHCFVDTFTKDVKAQALTEALGLWIEVFNGKSELIATPEEGAALINVQCNLMVGAAKWARTRPGCPPDHTKLCIKATEYPDSVALHPPLIYVQKGAYIQGLRYRVQADYFPLNCGECHRTTEACVCAQAKAMMDKRYADRAAHALAKKTARNAERNASEGSGSAQHTGTKAERVGRLRYYNSIRAKCLKQGCCLHYQTGTCHFNADTCFYAHVPVVRGAPPIDS